jgi:toxin FitB
MSGYLIDTCAISEFQNPSPDLGVVAWFARTDLALLFLSALTIGELRYGIALLKERKKRVALERWLASEVLLDFEGRVLPIDGDGAEQWGQLRARAKMAGRAIPVIDGLLAATALRHNLAVVTRNEEDFERVGARVVNPWSGPGSG